MLPGLILILIRLVWNLLTRIRPTGSEVGQSLVHHATTQEDAKYREKGSQEEEWEEEEEEDDSER